MVVVVGTAVVVRVGAPLAGVEVAVLVDEVDGQEELAVAEDLLSRPIRGYTVILAEDHGAVRYLGCDVEAMRRGHDGLACAAQCPEQLDQPHLAAGSRPVAGSSRGIASGLITRTEPIAILRFSPPDS